MPIYRDSWESILKGWEAYNKQMAEEAERQREEAEAREEYEKEQANPPEDDRSALSKLIAQVNVLDSGRSWQTAEPSEEQAQKSVWEQGVDLAEQFATGTEKVLDVANQGKMDFQMQVLDAAEKSGEISKEEAQRIRQKYLDDTAWAGFDSSAGNRAKIAGGVALETASEVVPFTKGAKALDMTMKGGAALGAGTGLTHATGGELASEDGFDPENLALETIIGGLAGGAFGGFAQRGAARRAARGQEVIDGGRIGPERQLGPGDLEGRLAQIDEELARMQSGEGLSMRSGSETSGTLDMGAPRTRAGVPDQRFAGAKGSGTVQRGRAGTEVDVKATKDRFIALNKERRYIERQLNREAIYDNVPEGQAVDNPASITNVVEEADDYFGSVDPNYSGGILSGWKTPERMMENAGLGKVMGRVRDGHDNFLRAERADRAQIADWISRDGISMGSEVRIGRWLDGDKSVTLNPGEKVVAEEMKAKFAQLAKDLDIPEEQRIRDYLPHIFKKSINKDPEIMRMIRKNSSADVEAFFRKTRTGADEYIEDAFEAYRIYTKKAALESHMKEPLELLQKSKAKVNRHLADEINDLMNSIKGVPEADAGITQKINEALSKAGFGPDAASRGSSAARAAIYRATLGFNTSSALRNVTQTANTFAEIGVKWTNLGAAEAISKMTSRNLDELIDMNILDDMFIDTLRHTDKSGMKSAFRKGVNKADRLLWAQFQGAEEFNRATAYFGAKAKAISNGMGEQQAKKYAAKIARKTQFKFSAIDTPRHFRGSISKNFTQLMSFNVKQLEFLKDKIIGIEGMVRKNPGGGYSLSAEGTQKLITWIGANAAFYYTVGQLIGMEPSQMVPFLNEVTEGDIPKSPITSVLIGGNYGDPGLTDVLSAALGGKDDFGNEQNFGDVASEWVTNTALLGIPGSTQAQRFLEGRDARERGYSETESGNVRFTMGDTPAWRDWFGQYSGPQAQEYFDSGREPIKSDTLNDMIKNAPSPAKAEQYYEFATIAQGLGSERTSASNEVTNLAKQGDTAKAIRRAMKWNMSVEDRFKSLFDEYGYDERLVDLISEYMMSVEPGDIRRRASSD